MRRKIDFEKIEGFDCDEGNIDKNWSKHKVYYKEAEEVFANKPFYLTFDEEHSQKEERFSILGITNKKRLLAVFFTIRDNKIRIISARNQDKKERKVYEKTQKNSGI